MQAELRGKLDVATSREAARLEDTLTDAVFAAFRYLPARSALAELLQVVFPGMPFAADDIERARVQLWPMLARRTEPDAAITVGKWLVLVEAKYRSGIGIDFDGTHQLEREWIHGRGHAAARRLRVH